MSLVQNSCQRGNLNLPITTHDSLKTMSCPQVRQIAPNKKKLHRQVLAMNLYIIRVFKIAEFQNGFYLLPILLLSCVVAHVAVRGFSMWCMQISINCRSFIFVGKMFIMILSKLYWLSITYQQLISNCYLLESCHSPSQTAMIYFQHCLWWMHFSYRQKSTQFCRLLIDHMIQVIIKQFMKILSTCPMIYQVQHDNICLTAWLNMCRLG